MRSFVVEFMRRRFIKGSIILNTLVWFLNQLSKTSIIFKITFLYIGWSFFPNASAQGQTYYVAPSTSGGDDSNPGTMDKPWQTIQKAADTMVAGDSVYIRSGTYQEQIIPLNSGSADNYITYTAYTGETATIDGTNSLPVDGIGIIHIEDISYIKIAGLKIINAGPNPNNTGILVDTAHHIILEKNYTYNTASSGIGVWNSNNIIIDGNEIELACNDGEQEDITVAGTDSFEIRNNHVHHGGPGTNGGEGIDAKDGSSNGKIYNNHVHHINATRTCLYLDSWNKHTFNIDVYQNNLHECGAGLSLASEDGGLLENINVYNNIIYENRANGLEIGNWGNAGISTRPIQNIKFVNNTVYKNGDTINEWGGGFFNENPDVMNILVRNNIFSENVEFQIANESPASIMIDYNLIDGSQGYSYSTNGNNYVTGNPVFINPGVDFHLKNTSPAIDAGLPTDAPDNDYDGNTRPLDGNGDGEIAYDIGAYEISGFDPNLVIILILQMSSDE